MVPHFPSADPRQRASTKRDDSTGTTGDPGTPARPAGPRRTARRPVVAACCVILSIAAGLAAGGSGVPAAQADPPDPRAHKRKLDTAIKASRADLHESFTVLQSATAGFERAAGQLVAVQRAYAVARGRLGAARAADRAAAHRLAAAEAALAAARAEVLAGERKIAESRKGVGRAVRSTYQQHTNLISLAIILRGASPADLATGAQLERNLFDVQRNALTTLRDAQAQLVSTQARVAQAERRVAAQRAEAAATVRRVAQLTAAVNERRAEVTRSAQARLRALWLAQRARRAELDRYRALLSERSRVERILMARARGEQAAERKRRKGRPAPPPAPGDGFVRPLNTYITSPYGMRFHPILRYWKLHDGTDFGGGCGTPIRAAGSGVVTDRYFNGGYGKRLFISHGIRRGRHLVSVYNHLSSYAVGVGRRVGRGQVIGYVGTTGYSTGCHLHFMIYQDGRTVNPMNWL